MGDAGRKETEPTPIKRHFKLVRSKIPEIIAKGGEHADWHPLTFEDTLYHLTRSDGKLQEEVDELIKTRIKESKIDEVVDVIQVVLDIAYHLDVSEEEVEALRKEKQEKKGDFKTGTFLVSSGSVEAYQERERYIKRVAEEMRERNEEAG